MSATTLKPPKKIPRNGKFSHSNGNDGNFPFASDDSRNSHAAQIGVWFFLASVAMLFGSITSAFLIRKAAPDWRSLYFPRLLFVNTGILMISGVALEFAKKMLKQGEWKSYRFWIALTTFLGCLFLLGQVLAWKKLQAHGIFLPTNPHSSFFYMLSGLHGVHLLGGILCLFLASFHARTSVSAQRQFSFLRLTAVYWHFMNGLWIYILVLLYLV